MLATAHMDAADAMDALERTRKRIERMHRDIIRMSNSGRKLGMEPADLKLARCELEEELTAVAVALDLLRLERP